MLSRFFRYLGIGLLASTGFGLFYILSRTYFISPNSKGIVRNYSNNTFQSLEPGVHVILNPFIYFEKEISTQIQTKRLNSFTVKSLDNVDALVQADITFQIQDPRSLYDKVNDPENTFTEQVKAAFSSAIQTLNFQHVTSAEVNRLAQEAGHHETSFLGLAFVKRAEQVSLEQKKSEDGIGQEQLIKDGANFFRTLLNSCKEWGIRIINFRILSIEAKHKNISEALELTAKTNVSAKAQLIAASSQAQTIKILAQAEKEAQLIRAEGAKLTAEKLAEAKDGFNVYAQETRVRVAKSLGEKSNLTLLMPATEGNDNTLSRAAFSTFANGSPSASTNDDIQDENKVVHQF